jgi:hypothetical protein
MFSMHVCEEYLDVEPCWLVTFVLEDDIVWVVSHHHLWKFQWEIGSIDDASNKHVLLFYVRLQY